MREAVWERVLDIQSVSTAQPMQISIKLMLILYTAHMHVFKVLNFKLISI